MVKIGFLVPEALQPEPHFLSLNLVAGTHTRPWSSAFACRGLLIPLGGNMIYHKFDYKRQKILKHILCEAELSEPTYQEFKISITNILKDTEEGIVNMNKNRS